jgi:hypothetical protein
LVRVHSTFPAETRKDFAKIVHALLFRPVPNPPQKAVMRFTLWGRGIFAIGAQ